MYFSCLRASLALTIMASLTLSAGSASLAQTAFEAKPPVAPEEGGPRRWVVVGADVQLQSKPSSAAEVIRLLEKGEVLSNDGCQEAGHQIWCNVRSFRGGRGGFVGFQNLQPARGPDGIVPMGVDDSRRRAEKRDFDAKSKIACAQERGQALGSCEAATAQSDGGDATVVVTFPNGFQRKLYFIHGEFVRASATMSGVGTDFAWNLTDDLYSIRVDDQRFELPIRLVFED